MLIEFGQKCGKEDPNAGIDSRVLAIRQEITDLYKNSGLIEFFDPDYPHHAWDPNNRSEAGLIELEVDSSDAPQMIKTPYGKIDAGGGHSILPAPDTTIKDVTSNFIKKLYQKFDVAEGPVYRYPKEGGWWGMQHHTPDPLAGRISGRVLILREKQGKK